MKTTNKISSLLIILLGLGHTSLTSMFYDVLLSPNALWFAATGFTLVFLGFINLLNLRLNDRFSNYICILSNIICLIITLLIVFVINEFQAYIALLLIIILLISSILLCTNK